MKRIPRSQLQVIKEELIEQILDNKYKPGDAFLSENELMERYQLSRGYIRQILYELELEGFIFRSQGRRTRVADLRNITITPPFLQNPTFAIAIQEQETKHELQIIQGFNEVANTHSIQTISYNMRFDENLEYQFLHNLKRMGIRGLALWTHFDTEQNRNLLHRLSEKHFPVVLIDRYLPGTQIDAVVSNNRMIGEKLTRALINKGHRRIAFFTSELRSSSARDRYEGYRSAIMSSWLDYRDDYVVVAPYEEVENATYRLFARRDKPTAIVYSFDALAAVSWKTLTQLGYAVPEDVEIATLADNDYHAKLGFPSWVFSQNSVEIGRTACSILIRRLEGDKKPAEIVSIPPVPIDPIRYEPGVR